MACSRLQAFQLPFAACPSVVLFGCCSINIRFSDIGTDVAKTLGGALDYCMGKPAQYIVRVHVALLLSNIHTCGQNLLW